LYRPVSACGLIRIKGERTRPLREWEGLKRRPTLFVYRTTRPRLGLGLLRWS